MKYYYDLYSKSSKGSSKLQSSEVASGVDKDFTECSASSSKIVRNLNDGGLAKCEYCSLEHRPTVTKCFEIDNNADCKTHHGVIRKNNRNEKTSTHAEKTYSKKQVKNYLCDPLISREDKHSLMEIQLEAIDRECTRMITEKLERMIPEENARLQFYQQIVKDGRYLLYIEKEEFTIYLRTFLINADAHRSKPIYKNASVHELDEPLLEYPTVEGAKESFKENLHREVLQKTANIQNSISKQEDLQESFKENSHQEVSQKTADIQNSVSKKEDSQETANMQNLVSKQEFLLEEIISQQDKKMLTPAQCKTLNKCCKRKIMAHIKKSMKRKRQQLTFDEIICSKYLLLNILTKDDEISFMLDRFVYSNIIALNGIIRSTVTIPMESTSGDEDEENLAGAAFVLDKIFSEEYLKLFTQRQINELNRLCRNMIMRNMKKKQPEKNRFIAFEESIESGEDLRNYIDHSVLQPKLADFLKSNKHSTKVTGNIRVEPTEKETYCPKFILNGIISKKQLKSLTPKQQDILNNMCRSKIIQHVKKTHPSKDRFIAFEKLVNSGEDLKKYLKIANIQSQVKAFLKENTAVKQLLEKNSHCDPYLQKENRSPSTKEPLGENFSE